MSFATNDERTAKRVSDALGTATEMRAMKNYAGHRLSPWLGHLMVSRQETARPLLTPGEVMQLPPDDELVLVSGCHPIRAKKARYFEDPQTAGAHPAAAEAPHAAGTIAGPANLRRRGRRLAIGGEVRRPPASTDDPANAGIRREPELPEHEEIAPEPRKPAQEFERRRTSRTTRRSARALQRRSAPSRARRRSIPPTTWDCELAMRHQAHVPAMPPDLAASKLADYAARKRVPQALVVEAALASHLSPDGRRSAGGALAPTARSR